MENSFVMIKPDGVQRELAGEIISKFEKKGVKIIGMKMMKITEKLAKKHYAEHIGKDFFDELIAFITSGPVIAMVMEGEDIINIIRKIVGDTTPGDAKIGTIRGDYVLDVGHNIIHASDSLESAKREINLFFNEEELIDYELAIKKWIYSIPVLK
ncbi:MAG: nucleoside-diphosphate kinase [Fusobacteriota bacterium]